MRSMSDRPRRSTDQAMTTSKRFRRCAAAFDLTTRRRRPPFLLTSAGFGDGILKGGPFRQRKSQHHAVPATARHGGYRADGKARAVAVKAWPMATVAYLISASQSDTEQQLANIQAAGFSLSRAAGDWGSVDPSSAVRDPPGKRREFPRMRSRLRQSDRLVVTELNRLGRTAVEVLATVQLLTGQDVLVHCLALGGREAELTRSGPGKMIMNAIAATVALERDERDRRRNARTKTKKMGRPPVLTENQRREALDRLAVSGNVSAVARVMGTSRQTIIRARKGARAL
jgi:putative DNA-invertase from lambdoid prophage Rac